MSHLPVLALALFAAAFGAAAEAPTPASALSPRAAPSADPAVGGAPAPGDVRAAAPPPASAPSSRAAPSAGPAVGGAPAPGDVRAAAPALAGEAAPEGAASDERDRGDDDDDDEDADADAPGAEAVSEAPAAPVEGPSGPRADGGDDAARGDGRSPRTAALVDRSVGPRPRARPRLRGVRFAPLLHLVGEYGARFPRATRQSNAFSLPRAHGGLEARWGGARARLLLDAAHATAGGALLGVAGDSLVVRVREAWAGYRTRALGLPLEARLGIVPGLASPALEGAWQHRMLGAVALERFQLAPPTDFGVSLRAHLPEGFGWAGVAITNGEGYTAREVNLGKNVEAALALRPLRTGPLAPLSLLAGASVGSSGLPESATVRWGGAALWDSRRLGAGVSAFGFRGLLADAARRGYVLEGFGRATLVEHLLLAARVQYLRRSLEANDDALDALLGAGLRLRALDVFVAYSHAWLRGGTRASLPASDGGQLRVLASFKLPGGEHPARRAEQRGR